MQSVPPTKTKQFFSEMKTWQGRLKKTSKTNSPDQSKCPSQNLCNHGVNKNGALSALFHLEKKL